MIFKKINFNDSNPQLDNYYQVLFKEYQKIFPTISSNNVNDLESEYNQEWLNTIKSYFPFYQSNYLKNLEINYNQPLDKELKGSGSRVFSGKINNEDVAVKIYQDTRKSAKDFGIRYIGYALREGHNLFLTSRADIGIKFYGYSLLSDGRLCVIMHKIKNGKDLDLAKNIKYINKKTLESFQKKMEKLHQIGYTFQGDSGQILLSKNGEVNFIDISFLHKINHEGNVLEITPYINEKGEIIHKFVKPTETIYYKEKVNLFRSNLKMFFLF